MLTKANKNAARMIVQIVITVMLVMIVLACLCVCSIYIWFTYTSKWKYNVENFEVFQEDFQTVADFCLENVEKNPEIIYFNLSGNNTIYCGTKSDAQEMDVSNDIINSFRNIEHAFPDSDAKLDVIYCADGAVYFTTHNGLYSLICSPTSKPTTLSGGNTEADTKKITDDWYHAVKK